MSPTPPRLGLVGGLGPLAGWECTRRLLERSVSSGGDGAGPDLMVSLHGAIPDRSAFLRNEGPNPGPAIARELQRLINAGAQRLAVVCNTAHAPPIWNAMGAALESLATANEHRDIELLHLVSLVGEVLQARAMTHIGLLATTGTVNSGLYGNHLAAMDIVVTSPDQDHQAAVHQAIYDSQRGLKYAGANPWALAILLEQAQALVDAGCQCIVLACTELSLIRDPLHERGIAVCDSVDCLVDGLLG